MSATNGSSRDGLLDTLESRLRDAAQHERDCQGEVEAARARCKQAREERKRVQRLLDVYRGTSARNASKETVRPVADAILSSGPLSEDRFTKELTRRMKAESAPLAGLAFVLRGLRNEYVDDDGQWRLPEDASKAAAKSPE